MKTTAQMVDLMRQTVQKKGYKFFENGAYNLNIIGIRSATRDANKFDDFITCTYKDDSGVWYFKSWEATTDPGNKSLKDETGKGTAILVPGQYLGTHAMDLHQGKYLALCQRLGNVAVYRDKNKDKKLDTDTKTITKGMFGINIHRASAYRVTTDVENWSAGCQVFADPKDFSEFMDLCSQAKSRWGNQFSYTLIESQDLL